MHSSPAKYEPGVLPATPTPRGAPHGAPRLSVYDRMLRRARTRARHARWWMHQLHWSADSLSALVSELSNIKSEIRGAPGVRSSAGPEKSQIANRKS
jgi:hypothetical protein